MSGRECIQCEQSEGFGPVVFAASGAAFVFLSYLAAWRPLFYSTEAAIVELIRKCLRISKGEEYQRPGVFGRFVLWLRTSVIDIIKIIFGSTRINRVICRARI